MEKFCLNPNSSDTPKLSPITKANRTFIVMPRSRMNSPRSWKSKLLKKIIITLQKHTSSRFKSDTNGERIWRIEVALMVLRLAKRRAIFILAISTHNPGKSSDLVLYLAVLSESKYKEKIF